MVGTCQPSRRVLELDCGPEGQYVQTSGFPPIAAVARGVDCLVSAGGVLAAPPAVACVFPPVDIPRSGHRRRHDRGGISYSAAVAAVSTSRSRRHTLAAS